jgi:hypothetical protein
MGSLFGSYNFRGYYVVICGLIGGLMVSSIILSMAGSGLEQNLKDFAQGRGIVISSDVVADGAVIFGEYGDPIVSRALLYSYLVGQPVLMNPESEFLRDWIHEKEISSLYVASGLDWDFERVLGYFGVLFPELVEVGR